MSMTPLDDDPDTRITLYLCRVVPRQCIDRRADAKAPPYLEYVCTNYGVYDQPYEIANVPNSECTTVSRRFDGRDLRKHCPVLADVVDDADAAAAAAAWHTESETERAEKIVRPAATYVVVKHHPRFAHRPRLAYEGEEEWDVELKEQVLDQGELPWWKRQKRERVKVGM